MAEVAAAFVLAAAVVFTGFVAMRVFQATRVPDIPILLAIGLLLGPLNRVAVHYGHGSDTLATALAPEALLPVAPYISALALIVILFDSGLKLDFREFQRSLRPALGHTLPIFLLTVLLFDVVDQRRRVQEDATDAAQPLADPHERPRSARSRSSSPWWPATSSACRA